MILAKAKTNSVVTLLSIHNYVKLLLGGFGVHLDVFGEEMVPRVASLAALLHEKAEQIIGR